MQTKSKVLVIDDESTIRQMIRGAVDSESLDWDEASTGREGIQRVMSGHPDVVVLDLILPDVDGLQVARELRSWTQVPIIVVSARDAESDRVSAFAAGADDFVGKPFSLPELAARIRVALRRSKGSKPVYDYGGLKVDLSARRTWKNGQEVHLTPYEYALLSLLVQNAGSVVSHELLLRTVWGDDYVGEVQYLRVYIGQLRHKLEQAPGRPKLLTTEAGVGYRLRTSD